MNATTPPEPPEDLGNTIDGTRVGDGATSRPNTDEASINPDRDATDREVPTADGEIPADGGTDSSGHAREEQKKVYQTPEQTDHALGGGEGTTDGS